MTFWELVGSVLASFGGAACIVALTIKFAGNMIAKRLSKKYDLQLSKELENIKSTLERKNYISKTRFDTEFQIYRELSKLFFNAMMSFNFKSVLFELLSSEKEIQIFKNSAFSHAYECVGNVHDALLENSPFIREDFYKKYNEIETLLERQISDLERLYIEPDSSSQVEEERLCFPTEFFKRSGEIRHKYIILNDSIRDYLFNLDVMQ